MIGGYESARRWNEHFNRMARQHADTLGAIVEARRAEIAAYAAARPDVSDFNLWYDWAQSVPEAKTAMEQCRAYDSGYSYMGAVYSKFRAIAGRE